MIDIYINTDKNYDCIVNSQGDFEIIGSPIDDTNIDIIIEQELFTVIYSNQYELLTNDTPELVIDKLTQLLSSINRLTGLSIDYDIDNDCFNIDYTI